MNFKLIPPAILTESTKLKSWEGARATLFWVRYKPGADISKIDHELMHVWQFWILGTFASLIVMYFFWPLWFMGYAAHFVLKGISKWYIKHSEAMAFAISYDHHPRFLNDYAKQLSIHYGLKITETEAKMLILKYHTWLTKHNFI